MTIVNTRRRDGLVLVAMRDHSAMSTATCWASLCICLVALGFLQGVNAGRLPYERLEKKSSTSLTDRGTSDYSDYTPGVHYDEYPVVVPKRTALLLDKIMVALQKAVDEDNSVAPIPPDMPDSTMDLQRRGNQKGRIYWRCYFNAVTCF